jgi:hypothetical protein
MTTAILYKGKIQWKPADERGVRDTGQTIEDNKFTRRRTRPDRPDRVEVTLEQRSLDPVVRAARSLGRESLGGFPAGVVPQSGPGTRCSAVVQECNVFR